MVNVPTAVGPYYQQRAMLCLCNRLITVLLHWGVRQKTKFFFLSYWLILVKKFNKKSAYSLWRNLSRTCLKKNMSKIIQNAIPKSGLDTCLTTTYTIIWLKNKVLVFRKYNWFQLIIFRKYSHCSHTHHHYMLLHFFQEQFIVCSPK